jgi:hypothetical protein
LSRRPKQPLDPEIDADDFDFEDWVDRLHGFMHQIQPLPFSKKKVFTGAQILSVEETDMKEITYEDIHRSEKDIKDDKKMEEVKEWQDFAKTQGIFGFRVRIFCQIRDGILLGRR